MVNKTDKNSIETLIRQAVDIHGDPCLNPHCNDELNDYCGVCQYGAAYGEI